MSNAMPDPTITSTPAPPSLVEALRIYGRHQSGCPAVTHTPETGWGDCTCGLSAALAAAAPQVSAERLRVAAEVFMRTCPGRWATPWVTAAKACRQWAESLDGGYIPVGWERAEMRALLAAADALAAGEAQP